MTNFKFKIGDKVTFTNDYGVKFTGKKITGYFEPKSELDWYHWNKGRYYMLDTDAYWFPHPEDQLTLEAAHA